MQKHEEMFRTMNAMNLPVVTLKPRKEIPLLGGHPWVFSGAIEKEPNKAEIEPGTIVKILSSDGRELGLGTYNPLTNIRVRLLTCDCAVEINTAFFEKKFAELDAWKQKHLPPNTNGYRLVHAETDELSGLIVDRYNDTFVFQLHTAGMNRLRKEIIDALKNTFHPKAIIERSDIEVRKQEGLTDMPIKVHHGDVNDETLTTFQENGYTFFADILHGQKTGFFLDQRDARYEVGQLAHGKRVLNLFCYTGAFSLYAGKNNASFVTSIDVSKPALEQAKKNFSLNHLDPNDTKKYIFEDHDIFKLIETKTFPHAPHDLIICDPPALAKSAAHLQNASRAYITLNQFCLSQLAPGGILVTSSCSGRITQEAFRDILRIAAGRAGKKVKILKWITQAADHAESLAFTEGRYLKTAILEVV